MKTSFFTRNAILALALMLTGNVMAQDFGSEEVVSEETTWVFNDYTTSDVISTEISETDKLYNRSTSGRGFKFEELGSAQELVFSDGWHVSVTKKAVYSGYSWSGGNAKNMTAGRSNTDGSVNYAKQVTPFFAFNVNVAGTCYAYVKGGTASSEAKQMRIYFGKADGTTDVKNSGTKADHNNLQEINLACDGAGVFFIGSTASTDEAALPEIYAIRFVPTATAPKTYVYIGSTGYATFGNNTGSHLDTPSGLTAYEAKPGDGSVTLTALAGIPQTAGVILKGTPDTHYPLTASASTYTVANNFMQRVTTNGGVVLSSHPDETHWNYILANDNGTAKFFYVADGSKIAKGKAYLYSNKKLHSDDARMASIVFDDETTNISVANRESMSDGKWYTLQGVEVATPKSGIYLKNGKKYIIK